ncbi:transcription-repair coupling factor [Rhodocytophaga aerolata]|uniref:Transcription-repair-coupling factor n=1 Tax=Rhodocytophaga aerolata TaxID=455078 RepID=A0ABT8R1C6_9BACT|nr:transcription-repair coupling factor [Rhodocytophaga aerolata]MDO1445118.1 transcription-repair coupling factor [Rhodocytophaga aerolata]
MKINDFIKLYQDDSFLKTIAGKTTSLANGQPAQVQVKGLIGSLDAVLGAVLYHNQPKPHLYILHDREEAAYFQNDLQNLMGDKEVLFFPTSYKRAYQFEETENANVLRRAEVLNLMNQSNKHELIITYPEALTEKVINKRSLRENTFTAKIGDKLDTGFVSEFLVGYDFDKTDFVYEPGQFSIRGGIIDVYSYAHDLPYRIELFGDEIESIRTFDPNTQLSVESVTEVSLIPDVQTKLLQETRESFLDFLPDDTLIFVKDVEHTLESIQKYYEKAEQSFQLILQESGNTKVVAKPEELFETRRSFLNQLKSKDVVEFGKRFYFKTENKFTYQASPQPSFNKDFKLLIENLHDNQSHNITNIIAADSPKQMERLRTIFDELDPFVKFQPLNISFREGFIDKQLQLACYTDHQIFERFHKYRTKEKFSKSKALTLKELRSLQPGDYVTHVDYGIGRFAGLEKVEVNGREQETIRLVYRDDDLLYVSIHALHKIAKYTGKEGAPPVMSKLGSQDWENKKARAKKQVKDIAKELIELYAKRRAAPGYAFSRDNFMQAELESSFIYEDTPDQAKATTDVKADMEQSHPMDRLVCGDVGFGKTEVAIRAAFKAVCDNKQVAVLVPTTVLAIQHYKTFKERLEKFPVKVEYINRFKTPQQVKETLKRVESGETSILIGTHRIVSKDIKFKDLGLMIIDEEQKFGVKTKEKLKEMRLNVDALTLTATPIPRTLHFSLMGARDLSIIATPPPNRQPVTTELHIFNEVLIRDAISFELRRGGQVFFVHNRVGDIEEIGSIILRLVPDAKIGVAHGQMDGDRLEKTMLKFIDGEFDILVSTNIIESGLDIPNANTIIINQAHMFGLSDLHQMRGRVGRSNRKAFCYLLTPAISAMTTDARKRLSTLEEFSELGDGFKVAMRDLDIRGAGNLLGAEQSGFISDLGFEMYHDILDKAVQELKESEFRDLFVKELPSVKELVTDCVIETDLQLLIPEKYVSSISERLSLYAQLDNIKDEEGLKKFQATITDRFGPMPEEVKDLVETVQLRWVAEKIGLEKLIIKNDTLKGYFMSPDNEAYYKSDKFGRVLQYLQKNPKKARLKEVKSKLIVIFENIKTIQQAKQELSAIDV